MTQEVLNIATVKDLRATLAGNYQRQIQNYFGNEKKALKFLSGVVSAVQANPKLLECEPTSVINSFMTMAQLELMPSNVSGEAYVLPYNDKRRGLQAQFQLGYQGLVTLFYRAGAVEIIAEIVREKDAFSYVNGVIDHAPDVFAEDRGKAIGAYVIVRLNTGGSVHKVMKASDIIGIGRRFSKSFNSSFTPWNEAQDPELWMWKKTVLKQAAKLVPKNEHINTAIAKDNEADSKIEDVKNRFEGIEMPTPERIAKKQAKKNEQQKEEEPEEEAPQGAPESTETERQVSADDVDGEVTYEPIKETDDIPIVGEEKTSAKDVVAKRNSLKNNNGKK